jgi:hypothetical protein
VPILGGRIGEPRRFIGEQWLEVRVCEFDMGHFGILVMTVSLQGPRYVLTPAKPNQKSGKSVISLDYFGVNHLKHRVLMAYHTNSNRGPTDYKSRRRP